VANHELANQTALVTTGDSTQLIAMHWLDGKPNLRLRRNSEASVVVALPEIALRYSASKSTLRRCIGHQPFRDRSVAWVDCDREPLAGSLTCDRCTAVNATFASQLHHAHNKGRSELDAAVLAHLDQPNHAYLAAFRDGSIKVGTSTKSRHQTRLDEQGAWVAQVVANAEDGFAVRSLEDRITAETGLPQSVSVRRKLDGLVAPKTDDQLRTELSRWTNRVHELIADRSDSRVSPANDGWVSGVSTDPVWTHVHPYPLRLDSGTHDLELTTASGRIVVSQRPGSTDRFVCDIRQLFGLVLTTDNTAIPDELAVQDSLF